MDVGAGGLNVIDAAARRWAEAARPIDFRIAAADEVDEVFRLRYRTIVEEGWVRPENFPDGLERDEYDDVALHIVGMDGMALAATGRIVFPFAERPLPTEEAFELTEAIPAGFVDLGRTVVKPPYRDNRHRIFAGLLGRSWLEARARGFAGIAGSASAAVIERYGQLGIRLAVLGPASRYWGEERFPVCLDVLATAVAFASRPD